MQNIQQYWKAFAQDEDNSSETTVCSLRVRRVFSRKKNINTAVLYSPGVPKPTARSSGRKPHLLAADNITQLPFNLQEVSLEFQSITLD